MPLLARGHVLGMLMLRDVPEQQESLPWQPFLDMLVDLAAHTLHNNALYDDLLRQKQELCTLIELGRDITASLDLDEVLRRVVRHATRLLRVQMSSLMLVDKGEQTLCVRATYGGGQAWAERPPVELADCVLGEVVGSGSPLAVLDIRDERGDRFTHMAAREGLRSFLCVPLQTNLQPLGLLTVYTVEPRRFHAEEVELLLALARQSAVAIENARLYRAMLDTQERLRQSERLVALGSLSAGLAHEIRNPLHTMQLLASAMREDCPPQHTLQADLAVMQDEIGRLTLLLDQFLDFARPKRPEVSQQKLQEIMEETLLFVDAEARRRGMTIRKAWPRDLPLIWVDGAQLRQVFLNILLNALQAMAPGGIVRVRMYSDGTSITTEIRDQGEGIPTEVQSQLFTPFFTTKPTGAGLGLSISQRIVEGHRGSIRILSEQGEGTLVRIVLPLATEKSHEKDPAGG
jgi:signal transduction histidine kinase